jgi:phosphate transport system substrate-binding protein
MDRARRKTRLTLAALGTVIAAAIAIAVIAIAAAGGGEDVPDVAPDDPGERRGAAEGGRSRTVEVSTAVQLLPLAKRTAELVARPPGVSVRVHSPGGDVPLTALCSGQADVALAERRLTADECETCVRNGLRPTAREIGHQAVAVYASRLPAQCLTLSELRRLFRPGSPIDRYSQLDPSLPDLPMRLLAPVSGHSATELFTRTVTGGEGRLRADLRVVRDTPDFGRILSGRPAALGIYGVGLVDVEEVVLDTVAVDAGEGCVLPRPPAVRAGRYPLAEPLYACTTRSAARREPVARYFETLVRRAPEFADYPGVVPPPATREVAR